MRRMKPSEPCGETRASARAAALSDAISSRCSRSSIVTLSFARRCVVEAWKTSLRAMVTGCVEVGVVLEEHGRGHHLGDAGDRALALRVLFPEHLLGVGVVDDGGGGAHVGHQVAARVDLVARQHRVGHLARHRDGAGARQLRLARLRARGRIGALRLLLLPLVAADAGVSQILTRHRSAAGPTQRIEFLLKRTTPKL